MDTFHPSIEQSLILESLVAKGFPHPSEYVLRKAAELEDRWPPMTTETRTRMYRALLREQAEGEENGHLREDDAAPVFVILFPARE